MAAAFFISPPLRNFWAWSGTDGLSPVFPPVQSALAAEFAAKRVNLPHFFVGEGRLLRLPALALDGNALCDRGALGHNALESRVVPVGGKVDPVVGIAVAVDEA